MTKIIIIKNITLDSYYNQLQDAFLEKQRNLPSNLPDIHISESERAAQSYYDAMAKHSGESGYKGDMPIGKLVV